MSEFSERILAAIELTVEERQELLARRMAETRKLVIECHSLEIEAWPHRLHTDPYQLHLIEPRTWRCIAIRSTWSQMHALVEDMKPVVRRRFNEGAKPCPVHPPIDPNSDED